LIFEEESASRFRLRGDDDSSYFKAKLSRDFITLQGLAAAEQVIKRLRVLLNSRAAKVSGEAGEEK